MKHQRGTIYLLHFSGKVADHAGHYVGWASNLEARLAEHRSGTGAKLMAAVKANGLTFECVQTWQGTRDDERKLKRRRNAPCLCPICGDERRAHRATQERARRAAKKAEGHSNAMGTREEHEHDGRGEQAAPDYDMPHVWEESPCVGNTLAGEEIPF